MAIPKITFESVQFDKKDYYTRYITTPKNGDVTVSYESFEDVLIVDDDYVSEMAQAIDDDIFYYVDDHAFFSMSDKDLAALIDKELA